MYTVNHAHMPNHSLVTLQNISKRFNGQTVLQDISLTMEKGQIVSLIGPNGAGKTTLVRVVLGLLDPDCGHIERAADLRIGYMPQKLHIDPTLPLNVLRFLQLANPSSSQCKQALTITGIPHLIENPIHSLSGGELQRALLARALLREPDLLVLDEPVQGVDVNGQQALYHLINQLRNRFHCGVLMVSHDLHLVMAATDQVICLNRHVCCYGSPQQVAHNPAFIELFGEKTALYSHNHDHKHDLHGEVTQPTADRVNNSDGGKGEGNHA